MALQNQDVLVECETQNLYPEHFGIEGNKFIYLAVQYLYSKQQTPNAVNIIEVLPSASAKKVVEDVGGSKYITSLMSVPKMDNKPDIYIKKIKQAYTRREVIRVCEKVKLEMSDEKANTLNEAELLSTLQTEVSTMTSDIVSGVEVYKMGDDTDQILHDRAETPNTVPGLETGWKKFDKLTNGGQPGDLIFVAARSKTGKSVTLLNWATNMGIHDQMPVLYIDTEMSSREQEDRLLANLSGIPHGEIVSGLYAIDTSVGTREYKMKKLAEAKAKIKNGNLYHIYMPNFTLEKITAQVQKFQMQHGIVALFFDYLKFPASMMSSSKQFAEWQMLGFLASGLKDLAGIMKIPIYSAVQENRSGIEAEKKNAGNVAGSDRILQLATKLIFLYNKSPDKIEKFGMEAGNQELYIAFQRNGGSDLEPIDILFHKDKLLQEEVG